MINSKKRNQINEKLILEAQTGRKEESQLMFRKRCVINESSEIDEIKSDTTTEQIKVCTRNKRLKPSKSPTKKVCTRNKRLKPSKSPTRKVCTRNKRLKPSKSPTKKVCTRNKRQKPSKSPTKKVCTRNKRLKPSKSPTKKVCTRNKRLKPSKSPTRKVCTRNKRLKPSKSPTKKVCTRNKRLKPSKSPTKKVSQNNTGSTVHGPQLISNGSVTSKAKSETEKPNFTCPICGKVCKSKSGLANHMKVHTRLEQKQNEEPSTPLISERYEKVTLSSTPHITGTSATETQGHSSSIKVEEPAILVQPPSSVPPSATNAKAETEKPNFTCPLCGKICKSKSGLVSHMKLEKRHENPSITPIKERMCEKDTCTLTAPIPTPPKIKHTIPPPPLPQTTPPTPLPPTPPPPKVKPTIQPTAPKFKPLLPQGPAALMAGIDFGALRRKAMERRQRLGIEDEIVENSHTE
ncbi:uncharacterized protein [Palaemon carinicauda]|uniref:uncharacterized protein n=1 Tax=Palaemon carinicauda TaxID=392227 RepID=UPI0035B5841E